MVDRTDDFVFRFSRSKMFYLKASNVFLIINLSYLKVSFTNPNRWLNDIYGIRFNHTDSATIYTLLICYLPLNKFSTCFVWFVDARAINKYRNFYSIEIARYFNLQFNYVNTIIVLLFITCKWIFRRTRCARMAIARLCALFCSSFSVLMNFMWGKTHAEPIHPNADCHVPFWYHRSIHNSVYRVKRICPILCVCMSEYLFEKSAKCRFQHHFRFGTNHLAVIWASISHLYTFYQFLIHWWMGKFVKLLCWNWKSAIPFFYLFNFKFLINISK